METEGLRNQLEFKSNSPFKDQIDRSSSSSIFEQLIEIRRISLPILETEGLQKSSWLDHQAHEAEGFIFLSLSRDPVSSCSLRQKASWILNSCELIIMLYEAEGLMHSQLNANQCLCCINTFFFSTRRSNTPWGRRPHCYSQFAHLIAIHGINWWSDGSSMAIAASSFEGASKKAFKDVAWILCRFTSSFIEARLRFESEELLNRFILFMGLLATACQSRGICVFDLSSRLSNSFDSIDKSCYLRYCRIADNCFLNSKAIF